MKIFSCSFLIIVSLLFFSGCTGKGGGKKDSQTSNGTIAVTDTGYTGIKQYMIVRLLSGRLHSKMV